MKIFEEYHRQYQLRTVNESRSLAVINEGSILKAVEIAGKAIWKALLAVKDAFIKAAKFLKDHFKWVLGLLTAFHGQIIEFGKFAIGSIWGEYVDKDGETLTGVNIWNDKTKERIRINYKGGYSSGIVHSVDYWESGNSSLTTPTRTMIIRSPCNLVDLGPMIREMFEGEDGEFSWKELGKNLKIGRYNKKLNDLIGIEKGRPSETTTTAALKKAAKLDDIYELPFEQKTETILRDLDLIDGKESKEDIFDYIKKNNIDDIENITMYALMRENDVNEKTAAKLAAAV